MNKVPSTGLQAASNTTPALRLDNLHCERDDRVLFTGLSVDIYHGDTVQIVGPNGAGKTSLMGLITGTGVLDEGEIYWQGKAARGYHFYSNLLYLGHAPGVNVSLTALENLRWYFGLNGTKSPNGSTIPSDDKLLEALAMVGLEDYDDVQCDHMSAGQQRRVALARLYLSQARLWVLDEPYTAIDKVGVAALEARFQEHVQNDGIIILTTHQSPKLNPLKVINLAHYREAYSGQLEVSTSVANSNTANINITRSTSSEASIHAGADE